MRFRSFLRSPNFIVILAPFVLYAPVLFGGAMFWGTPVLQFHPWHVAAWEALQSGHLPLWNPLSGMGAPLIANYQSALFYPPNWFYFLLAVLGGNAAMAWGMGLLTAAHLSLAGAGMVRLTRYIGLSPLAQTISGLAFGLSGYLVARAHFLSINVTVAWLPWILWAGYEGVVTPKVSRHTFLRLTFFLAMLLLAGHAQTAWYTLLLTGLWLLFWTWQTNLHPAGFARILSFFVLAGLAAAALAAVQLIPTAELLSQSQRAGGADYEFVMNYSFWPWRLLGLLVPGFFGNPAAGDYWGFGTFWEDAIYIGLLPFLLALRTIPSIFKKNSTQSTYTHNSLQNHSQAPRLIQLLWLLTGISILLALGQNTPIFPFLYRNVPTFDTFQAPARWMLWAEFSLALLAGLGAETWQRPVGKRARARTLRGLVIAVAILIAALAAKWIMPEITPSFIRATALAGGLGVVTGLFSLYAPKSENYAYRQGITDEPTHAESLPQNLHIPSSVTVSNFSFFVGLFVAFDLILAGWGLAPGTSLVFYRGESENAASLRGMLGTGRLYISSTEEHELTYERYLRFDTFHADFTDFRASMIPNLNLLDNLPSANNFDPLRPDRYVQWMDALDAASYAQQKQMLGMMGVTVIERYAPDTELGATFESFPGNARFQWVPCVWPATDGENAWDLLFEHPPQLEQAYLIVEGYETNAQYVCGEENPATVHLVEESANEIRLQVDGNSSGWVFVADTWYPGWTAEVNGETAQVYRANYLFRTVQVPAGGGEVVMRYRPVGFWIGAIFSIVSWLGMGILALKSRFDGRNE